MPGTTVSFALWVKGGEQIEAFEEIRYGSEHLCSVWSVMIVLLNNGSERNTL